MQLRHQLRSSGRLGATYSDLRALLSSVMEELRLWLRGAYLALLFAPVVAAAPLVFAAGLGGSGGRDAWMDLMLWTIEHAGEQR